MRNTSPNSSQNAFGQFHPLSRPLALYRPKTPTSASRLADSVAGRLRSSLIMSINQGTRRYSSGQLRCDSAASTSSTSSSTPSKSQAGRVSRRARSSQPTTATSDTPRTMRQVENISGTSPGTECVWRDDGSFDEVEAVDDGTLRAGRLQRARPRRGVLPGQNRAVGLIEFFSAQA